MSTTWIRTAALAALTAASFQAHGATVTLTGWAFGTGNNVNTTRLSVNGNNATRLLSVNRNNVTTTGYSGAAGAFRGALSDAGAANTNSFVTYCIELEEFFSFSSESMKNFAVVDGRNYFQDRRGDGDKAERLGQLLTYVSQDATRVDIAADSTSMQLAVWNIVYDNDWSVSAGNGFRDTSQFASYADDLLAGAQRTASGFDVFALQRVNTQDFLLATRRVPEPASLALVAVALACLGLTRRRSVSRVGAAAA